MRGIIVLSGNDACAVLAEALSPDGTEAGFARYMTQRAQQMGMTNSTFANSTAAAAGHRMSMRDLALLSRRIIEDFPGFYPMFAETDSPLTGAHRKTHRTATLCCGWGSVRWPENRPHAGSGLWACRVGQTGDRRVVFVISGLDSAQIRAEEAQAIVNWAFRQFVEKSILDAGTEVARADVWMGDVTSVGLTPAKDINTLLPVLGGDDLKAEVVYQGPVRAPIAKGDELANWFSPPRACPKPACRWWLRRTFRAAVSWRGCAPCRACCCAAETGARGAL